MKIISVILFFISASAMSTTLFVSDIDDTIKISHVLNRLGAIEAVARIDNHFLGMAQAYQAYLETDPLAQIVYLTNAPAKLMHAAHSAFLHYNKFPAGQMLLRKDLHETEFKLKSLRSLIEKNQPTKMVLIGDNGERDPYVYAQIQTEYPNIPMFVYIHLIYSTHAKRAIGAPKQANQTSFVTSLDLVQKFQKDGLIPDSTFNNFVLEMQPKIVGQSLKEDEGNIAFPKWIDCRDYFGLKIVTMPKIKSNQSIQTNPDATSDDLWSAYQAQLLSRCTAGPIK